MTEDELMAAVHEYRDDTVFGYEWETEENPEAWAKLLEAIKLESK